LDGNLVGIKKDEWKEYYFKENYLQAIKIIKKLFRKIYREMKNDKNLKTCRIMRNKLITKSLEINKILIKIIKEPWET